MSCSGSNVLDPFCGRGTAPFVAQATGRSSLGIDINPAAWVFAKVKTSPEPSRKKLMKRVDDLQRSVCSRDRKAVNEFQKWAWSNGVLGFLNAARRVLDWEKNITDRTVMGFILVNLHGRLGDSVSNQMQKSRAMGPGYAVQWWKERKMYPPEIDPREYFHKKILWRYGHNVVDNRRETRIIQGDAAKILRKHQTNKFSLLFTSPPYFGVTDYRQDSWIRLWMLGKGPSLPDWKKEKSLNCKELYQQMLRDVFSACVPLLQHKSVIWVRTDAREFTKRTTLDTLQELWPTRKIFRRFDRPQKKTQTEHFGNKSIKSGEVDFLIPGNRALPAFFSGWKQL